MELQFRIDKPSKSLLKLLLSITNKRKKAKNNLYKTMGKDYYNMSLRKKYFLINHFKQKC